MFEEESDHVVEILEKTRDALKSDDVFSLKEMSNYALHEVSRYQDSWSITLAVLIYTLAKLIERLDHRKIKNWNKFVNRFSDFSELAIKAINEKNQKAYENYLEDIRRSLETISVNLKPYINEVFKKSAINNASKIYGKGVSLEQTAKLLGVSQWELSEYTAQSDIHEAKYNKTISTKKRVNIAMEFFS